MPLTDGDLEELGDLLDVDVHNMDTAPPPTPPYPDDDDTDCDFSGAAFEAWPEPPAELL